MAKVIVFKKNSPWGTVRDAKNNIVYRHIINFVDHDNNFSQVLKDEFVNEFFCSPGEDYKDLLNKSESIPFKYIDELNVQFTATLKNQQNRFSSTSELEMSDFAAVKIGSEIRFYVLSVISRTADRIVFIGNIDIFFSFNLRFNNERKNYVIQSHIDRFKDLNPDWENQLIQEDYKVPLLISEEKLVNWDYPFHSASQAVSAQYIKKFESVKWVLIYYKAQSYGSEKINNKEVTNPTGFQLQKNINNQQYLFNCPYNIVFFPVDFESQNRFLIKKNDGDVGKYVDFKNILNSALKDNDLVLSIKLLDTLPFNLFGNYPMAEITRRNDDWLFNFRTQHWLNPFKFDKSFTFLSAFKKDGALSSSSVFVVGELNEFQYDKHFLKSKKIELEQPKQPTTSIQIIQPSDFKYETKLFTIPYLVYALKWWNSEAKVYNLPFLKDRIVNLISSLNPENDSLFAFLELTNQDVLINNSSVLSNSVLSEIPNKTDAYMSFMRTNKNQIAIQEKYSEVSVIMGSILTALGAIALISTGIGAAAGAGLGAGAAKIIGGIGGVAAGGGASQIISGVRGQESIKAVQDDLQNKSPAVNPGNNLFLNMVMNKTKRNELHYIIQKPNSVHRKIVHDNMVQYGYKVLQLKKLKDVVNSRYMHNYIVANDVFNALDNKLSPRIKEIISNAFLQGLSIWHYRNKQTWKGILAYEYENWEMSVLKQLNKI